MTQSLQGKTLFITGASRGIGLAIAKRAAAGGANVVIVAKTTEPHPKLAGTIYSAAEEVEAAGGKALPIACDIREEEQVTAAVQAAVDTFGGIDICVNNASAINMMGSLHLKMKGYDLMHDINARGTFLVTRSCIPYLKKAENPHVLALAPPLEFQKKWFESYTAYTLSKFNMSAYMYGFSSEFRKTNIGFNCLWPRTTIATAAVGNLPGGDMIVSRSRKPEIMADAAYQIFLQNSANTNGNFFIDDEVLESAGITDLEPYSNIQGSELLPDLFVPER